MTLCKGTEKGQLLLAYCSGACPLLSRIFTRRGGIVKQRETQNLEKETGREQFASEIDLARECEQSEAFVPLRIADLRGGGGDEKLSSGALAEQASVAISCGRPPRLASSQTQRRPL